MQLVSLFLVLGQCEGFDHSRYDPHYEAKNETFPQTLKNSTIRHVLMRGFQIGSQNTEQRTSNLLLGPKTVKT